MNIITEMSEMSEISEIEKPVKIRAKQTEFNRTYSEKHPGKVREWMLASYYRRMQDPVKVEMSRARSKATYLRNKALKQQLVVDNEIIPKTRGRPRKYV
jgi:hypothetical protein